MDTLNLAAFFGALHRHGIEDTTGLSIDITASPVQVRAYTLAAANAIRAVLKDERAVHGWEPNQAGRWHGTLAGVVVRLILIDTRKDVAA